MGKTIIGWSPVHGQGATTSNLAALASSFALDYTARNLITHTLLNFSSLESLFGSNVVAEGFEDTGITALGRLTKSNLLKPDTVMDYTEAIYRQRLDLLGGKSKVFEQDELMEKLIAITKEAYDIQWVDAHSGGRNVLTKKIMEKSDLVIVNLPQNRYVIERFFTGEDFPKELEGKKYIVLISSYDKDSYYTIRKIKRTFDVKQPIFAVPYSTFYKDAANAMKVTEFFYKNRTLDKNRPMYEFLKEIKRINAHIAKELGLNRPVDDEEDYD